MSYLLLVIGFILIIKASDILIDASKSIAIKFRISKLLIALTIVAFGTCAPELAISFKSIIDNNGSIALANVLGSCIVNILLVIGLAAMYYPIKVKNATIKKELPLLVIITLVFTVLLSCGILIKNSTLNMFDGLILLSLFILFLSYIIKLAKKKDKNYEEGKYGIVKSIIYLIVSIIIITYSADLLVDNSIIIANDLGISEKVITMVAIVIGTSLPELFLTVAASRRKEQEMAIGNIIGTNIFNICVVMGLPIALFNGFKIIDFNLIDILVVLIASLLLFIFAKSEKTISKKEGIILISIFILYYAYVIFV